MTDASLHINGAWTQLLSDWLDQENLIAPALRSELDSLRPTDQISIARWQELLAQAAMLKPELATLGLAIGAQVRPRHVGLLGYLVLSCRTLGEAMLAYQRYENLFYGKRLAQVESDGLHMTIAWPQAVSTGALADTVSISALVTFLRRLVSTPPAPQQVSFVFPAPTEEAQAAFATFFACPVEFAAPRTAIRFPLTFLGLPLQHSDPALRQLLDRQAQVLLAARPEADVFLHNVRQTLARLLPEGRGSVQQVGLALHWSVRTLQRRLAHSGQTWQQLLDETRATLAADYLADPALSLADIALLLGFSEHSAFSRAYRRWHGTTPGKQRANVQAS